jgi:hypothetical protein
MAREASITSEQISVIADNIKAQGGRPTARAVRDAIGTGSMATILKLLQQWRAGQVRQSEAIDDRLDPAVAKAISNQIAIRVQDSTSELTARLADLQTEIDIVIAENEKQGFETDAQYIEIASLNEQNASLVGRMQQLDADAVRLNSELIAERQAVEVARIEHAKAQLRLEAVPRVEAENDKLRHELTLASNEVANQHEIAAVSVAKMEAANETVKDLRETLRSLKEEATVANTKSEKLFAELIAKENATAKALETERLIVQSHQSNLENIMRELATAQQNEKDALLASKRLATELAELRDHKNKSNITNTEEEDILSF